MAVQENPSQQQMEYVRPQWKIWHSFMILLLTFALGTAVYIFFANISGSVQRPGGILLLENVLQFACFFLAPLYIAGIRYQQPPQALGLRQKPLSQGLGKAMLWGLLLFSLNVLASLLLVVLFPGHQQEQQTVVQALMDCNNFELCGLIFCLTVLVPVSEEIFFRAFMMGALEARFGLWPAVIISASIFGAMHESIWNFLPLFAGGCGFALLYAKYRDISLNIIAHATWNSIAILLMFAARGN
jgi:membrane protease YdiL (CAAX protease family)